jgi:predicted nucleic acid-binding protein
VTTFVDTSALLALLDASESHQPEAAARWRLLLEANEPLMSTNYVLVETFAVVQRRLGLDALRALVRDVVPLFEVEWVSEELHQTAVAALLAANRRGLSLVDCTSFETMRRHGLTRAFAFDQHFDEQGFESTDPTAP